jgi:glycerol-3-phosphate acyltransferase PlsX
LPSDYKDKQKQPLVISIDAMGGDRGPKVVIDGISKSLKKYSDTNFIIHGQKSQLSALIENHPENFAQCKIVPCEDIVTMEDKPSNVIRNGSRSSMWSTIEAVRNKQASIAISCGNTGALMALSMVRLRKLPGVIRPAIACLWPSTNKHGLNILLDVGADVKADALDLSQYAQMGVSYARNGLNINQPRVGLLNIGTEQHKGRPIIKQAYDLINAKAKTGNYKFVGFVEGSDIPSAKVDVIVTDGFTGNIALKTGEGTAKLIRERLNKVYRSTILSRISALLAARELQKFANGIDPRRVNGGVFLGLNGTVIKSHGDSDPTGVAAAIELAINLTKSGFNEKLAARIASETEGL